MNHPINLLQAEVDRQTAGLIKVVSNSEPEISILMLIREMDIHWMFADYFQDKALNGNLSVLEAIQSGWHLILRTAYSSLTTKSEPAAFFYQPHHSASIMPLIRCSGHTAYVQRVVDMARHQLVTIEPSSTTDFSIVSSSSSFN